MGRGRTISRMRDSIGDVIMLHEIWRVDTTGSTLRTIRGMAEKPNQTRLLGGFLILKRRVPSISLRTTARMRRTE